MIVLSEIIKKILTFSSQTTKLLSVGALSLAASSWCESSPETGCAVDCGREIEDHNPQSQALFLSFKCELFTLIVH